MQKMNYIAFFLACILSAASGALGSAALAETEQAASAVVVDKSISKEPAEEPPFEYKLGLNGLFRGEGGGNITLTDSGYTPGRSDGRFLYRVKPYLYWHPLDWLDTDAEGQVYGFTGGYNQFSLYQGFFEVRLPGSDKVALKGGRQEVIYGSAFILGADSFYDGLTLDAARLWLKPVERLDTDILGGSYAKSFSGGVEGTLVGAYATYTVSEGNALEGYFFRDSGSAEHHAGEYLATWGMRGTASLGPVSAELEPVYQSGRTFNAVRDANDRVDAFGGHVDVSVASVLGGHNNKVFVSYAYGSGSSDAANGISAAREFRNPNNDTSLVGDMHVVSDLSGVTAGGHHASGLQIYTLVWGVGATKELNSSATGRYFCANRVESGFSRKLGLETDFTLTYAFNGKISVIAGYDRFFTGAFFRDTTGSRQDIHYGYLMLQFDLAHQVYARRGGTSPTLPCNS